MRHHLLARPRLSREQHRRLGRGHFRRLRQHVAPAFGGANRCVAALGLELRREQRHPGVETGRSLLSGDALLLFLRQALVRERQGDEVGDPPPRRHVGFRVRIRGVRKEVQKAQHVAAQAHRQPQPRRVPERDPRRTGVPLERLVHAARGGAHRPLEPCGLSRDPAEAAEDREVLLRQAGRRRRKGTPEQRGSLCLFGNGYDAVPLAGVADQAEQEAIVRDGLASQHGNAGKDLVDIEALRQDAQERSQGLVGRGGSHLAKIFYAPVGFRAPLARPRARRQ